MRGRSAAASAPAGAVGLGPVLAEVELRRPAGHVLDVEERVAVEADRDEGRLYPRQDPVHASEVDVSDEGVPAPALVEHLDDAAVLRERHARFGRGRVDEKLFPHALANRRKSTPRIRPMPRKVVASEDPP